MTRKISWLLGVAFALGAGPALPQGAPVGGGASVSVGSGPHKGKYDFLPTEPCVLAAFGKKPLGISIVLSSETASLSLDIPNLDEKHAHEVQVVLVLADVKPGQTRKNTASVTYEIDTRPDASLEPYQKAERANKGVSGKATTQLLQQGANAMVTFSGETQSGVKLSGEVNCRKVESE